jgi:putative transposase
MLRTYSYPLRPTKQQAQVLSAWIESCRCLYNAALEQRRDAYRKVRKTVSLYDQYKDLTNLRTEPEWKTISAEVLRSSLTRLDRAFKAFFRRVENGEKSGYPRFKGKGRYDSFSFGASDPVIVDKDRVKIPLIGYVRFHRYRQLPAQSKIKEVQIKRSKTDQWYVHFILDLGEASKKIVPKTSIGIDLGLTHFATLSNDEQIDNPRFYRNSEKVLARRQRKLARKQRKSRSRERARILVAKAHQCIQNQRKDFARKTAKELVGRYDLIAVEDLNIKGMVQTNNFGKSITDVSWGYFLHCLAYKAEEAGKWVIGVNPRNTSQTCSGCGKIVKKDLSERTHSCPFCGLVLDRDHNAAKNIHALGLSVLEDRSYV